MKSNSFIRFLWTYGLLLFGTLALHAQSLSTPAHYEVFLLAGQSNMDGRAKISDLQGDLGQWLNPQANVLIAFHGGGLKRPLTLSNGFQPLVPGYSGTVNKNAPSTSFKPGETFGPEVSFGATLSEALPGKKILLIKCSEGGTNLVEDWSPEQKGKLYDQFIGFVRQNLDQIKSQGDTYTVEGMIWHQGESDWKIPSTQYQDLLTQFIRHIRSDLQIPDLSFVIGEIFAPSVSQAEKATITNVPHTALAPNKGLKTGPDKIHLDAISQIELGKRYASAMLSLMHASP